MAIQKINIKERNQLIFLYKIASEKFKFFLVVSLILKSRIYCGENRLKFEITSEKTNNYNFFDFPNLKFFKITFSIVSLSFFHFILNFSMFSFVCL